MDNDELAGLSKALTSHQTRNTGLAIDSAKAFEKLVNSMIAFFKNAEKEGVVEIDVMVEVERLKLSGEAIKHGAKAAHEALVRLKKKNALPAVRPMFRGLPLKLPNGALLENYQLDVALDRMLPPPPPKTE